MALPLFFIEDKATTKDRNRIAPVFLQPPLPIITTYSYNLSIRKSFVPLAEIIKMSKCQNSAWLCGFPEVPYLSLNKRLGLVHERGVWVRSFTSSHKSYSLIASIRTGAIPYPIRFYPRIVSRVSSTKHAKRKLNQELPFLIYLFLQRRTAPHRTEQTANATETFATSPAPVSGLVFSTLATLAFTNSASMLTFVLGISK